MDKKIILGVLLGSALIIVVGILLPPPQGGRSQFLPWQVAHTADGSTRVFGITLGKTTLAEAERMLNGAAEVTLFVTADGEHRVEAYFDKVGLGGFAAKLVLVLQLPPGEVQAMFDHGVRISTLGSGANKVTLASEDLRRVYGMPVASLTYLTRATLDDSLIRQRFGQPAGRIREPESGTTHWLYPALGLDIALDAKGRAVLQYVPPTQFDALAAPLRALSAASNGGKASHSAPR